MIQNPAALNRTSFLQHYVTWLLVFLALTGLIDVFSDIDVERPINLHHIWALLGLSIFIAYGRVVLPALTINVFFAILFAVSGIAAIQHGVHPMLLNSVYCFYLCCLGLLCSQLLTTQRLLAALRASSWIILGIITIKNIFYLHDILDMLSTMQSRVFIPTVIAGGINIEATFALFAATLLRGSRSYWPAFAYALVLAILYSSRVAMLGCALLFAYEFFAPTSSLSPQFKRFRIVALLLGAAVVLWILFLSPITQFALSRFENIGYEPGSEGRMVMWQTTPEIFLKNPMGVGAGNVMVEIEKALGHEVEEGNLHNIYLQILLDLGILGFIAYGMMIYTAAQRGFAHKDDNPLWLAIGLYFLMGTLQFRAYDPFLFFWLGLAWHKSINNDIITRGTENA